MQIEWAPLLTFVLVASFTPGPNNLNSAAMGMNGGYRKTLPFMLGIYCGVAFLLTLVGFLRLAVSEFFFRYVIVFKIVGSAYLLWLAFSMVRKNGGLGSGRSKGSYFLGLTLQLVNPKGLFFAMTFYALFLTGDYSWSQILILSFGMPVITFSAVSTWALAGSFLSRYLSNPTHRKIFYWVCALLLVYTVVTILTQEFVGH